MKKSFLISMHLETPRIAPLPESEWDDETRELLGRAKMNGRVFNVFKTIAHHPKLLKRWLVFGNHILGKSTLGAREREILILRTAWRWRSTAWACSWMKAFQDFLPWDKMAYCPTNEVFLP